MEKIYEEIKINKIKINEKNILSRNVEGTFNKLKSAKVCILGLGGLGSNAAVLLARAGIGYLKLVDFDIVEASNLNRQQYRIADINMKKTEALKNIIEEINPFVKVEILDIKVDEKNLHLAVKDTDIIIEAFDNAETKAMLIGELLSTNKEENIREKKDEFAKNLVNKSQSNNTYTNLMNKKKIVISASGMAGLGSSNEIQTKKINKNFYLIGDFYSDYEEFTGIMSTRVMLCAAHQANLVLRIILGEEKENE